jgi:hypothetical protein
MMATRCPARDSEPQKVVPWISSQFVARVRYVPGTSWVKQ